jgi:hypothetical protein
LITRGVVVVFSVKLVRKHDDRDEKEKLPTKRMCHYEVGLLGISWISQDRGGYC